MSLEYSLLRPLLPLQESGAKDLSGKLGVPSSLLLYLFISVSYLLFDPLVQKSLEL